MSLFLKDCYEKILSYYDHPSIRKLPLTYGQEKVDLAQHVVIDNTCKRLGLEHFIFKLEDQTFELSEDIRALTTQALNKKREQLSYTNDKNVRLKKVEQINSQYILHTQPVFYETHLRTNMVMDFPFKNGQTLRETVHPEGAIEPLETSLLANQLGINILIFTKEGDLILTRRSNQVIFAAGQIAPSVSGSLSLSDISDGMTFTKDMIFREGVEELGLDSIDIAPGSIVFLGLIRELSRGGKPDFYFTLRLKISFHDVINRWKQAVDYLENEELIRVPFDKLAFQPLKTKADRDRFDQMIAHLLRHFQHNMSLSLLANLSLWVKYKRHDFIQEELLA